MNHKDCVNAYKTNPDNVPTECVTDGDPSAAAKAAAKVKVAGQQSIPTSPEAIVGEINRGIPVEIGIDVYQTAWAFNNPKSAQFLAGVVKMPVAGDKVIGGHAVLIVGYDTQNQVYLFKNSWGTDEWGSTSLSTKGSERSRWITSASSVRLPSLPKSNNFFTSAPLFGRRSEPAPERLASGDPRLPG